MRIAFLGGLGIPADGRRGGGIENYMEQVGTRLVRRGHEVTVYCRSFYTRQNGYYKGVRIVRLPTIRSKHLEAFVHTFLSSIHCAFGNYDIIQFHALGPSFFSIIPRLFGKRTVVSVRGLDWRREKWGRFASWFLRKCEYCAVHFPSKTTVVSPVLKDYFQKKYSIPVTYIPNGFTPPVFREPNLIREQFGLSRDEYILFVGRLVPEKGCHLLIEAFKELETEKKLVLVGGASHTESYVEHLKRIADDRVVFVGNAKGPLLEELYTNAYLFVLPSTIEGLSNSLLEAMSYGKCVLTSDIPENKVIVEGHGFTFRTGDKEDLKVKLKRLLQDGSMVKALGRKARLWVEDRFSWETVTELTERFYEAVNNR